MQQVKKRVIRFDLPYLPHPLGIYRAAVCRCGFAARF
jgi:hypothetical protein